MSAAYDVTLSFTDSESIRFDVVLHGPDGEPLPVDGLAFEYVLWGCETIRLTEENGVTADTDSNIVTVALDPERRLHAGKYQHGFRSIDENGGAIQHFDGTLSISCGGFR
jgi:hypothetical protein